MDGWVYLPRFMDKIRLHLAGKLHPDYQNNFTNGFDAACRGRDGEAATQLKTRKEGAGFGQRDDIQTFVDMIDADEKRL